MKSRSSGSLVGKQSVGKPVVEHGCGPVVAGTVAGCIVAVGKLVVAECESELVVFHTG